MEKEKKKSLWSSLCSLIAFVLWTLLVSHVDVKAIGPRNSEVGLATLNAFVHSLTGVHMTLYTITDWAGLVPVALVMVFAVLGLVQWIKRKKLSAVDFRILTLGGFYIVVFAVYILFEYLVINYRPVLIDGVLEASYPSSTTMLVMCVIPSAMIELNDRINNKALRYGVLCILAVFTVFMVVLRLISGVHWVSDIIGGVLLSLGLVSGYRFIVRLEKR